jgi:hypothetical protein
MFADVDIKLGVPDGQVIALSPKVCEILRMDQRHSMCSENNLSDRNMMVTPDGKLVPEK